MKKSLRLPLRLASWTGKQHVILSYTLEQQGNYASAKHRLTTRNRPAITSYEFYFRCIQEAAKRNIRTIRTDDFWHAVEHNYKPTVRFYARYFELIARLNIQVAVNQFATFVKMVDWFDQYYFRNTEQVTIAFRNALRKAGVDKIESNAFWGYMPQKPKSMIRKLKVTVLRDKGVIKASILGLPSAFEHSVSCAERGSDTEWNNFYRTTFTPNELQVT